MTFRMLAWMIAMLSATGWISAAEPPTTLASYKDVETAFRVQSDELQELRARLVSLEREIAYADSGWSGGHDERYGQGPSQTRCTPHGCGGLCGGGACCESAAFTFYGGGEVVWLKPHFRTANAYTRTGVVGVDTFFSEIVPLEYSFDVSGRYWLGAQTANGTGVRVRYWRWEHMAAADSVLGRPGEVVVVDAAIPNSPIGGWEIRPNPGETVDMFHNLEMHTLDLEATQDFQLGSAALRVAGGIRYLRLTQQFGANLVDALDPESMRYRQSLEGIGPTLAIEMNREIAFNLSFYSQARGSVAFGDRNERLTVSTPLFNIVNPRYGADDMISVGELGIGVQADFGPVFIRTGYEGQIWWNVGGPNDGSGDMGLHGFGITAGMIF